MKALQLAEKLKLAVSPVYLFTGEDAYMRDLALRAVRATVPEEYRDVSCLTLEGAVTADEIVEAADTMSFAPCRRIVEVRGVQRTLSAEEIGRLTDYARNPNDSTVLIFSDSAKTFDAIAQYCVKVECAKAGEDELYDYFFAVCQKSGFSIEPSALRYVVRCCGCDLGKVTGEVKKLMLYCYESRKIDAESARVLTTPDTESKVFELTNALQRSDPSKALQTLNLLVERGEKAPYLLAIVIAEYRKQFHIAVSNADEATLCKVLGISKGAYAVNKKIVDGRKRTKAGYIVNLKETLDLLYDLEYRFKSGEISPDSALNLAMGRLIAQSADK